jgi:hypothetical protein
MLGRLLSRGTGHLTGIILEPSREHRFEEVLEEARRQSIECVLDPVTLELATPVGFTSERAKLPWAAAEPDSRNSFSKSRIAAVAHSIASHVAKGPYSGVLSPTHFIGSGNDPWLDIDVDLGVALRHELDTVGLRNTPIYYSLALSSSVFRSKVDRVRIIERLRQLQVDAIWFRVHPFGTSSSGTVALRRYVEGCRDFHPLGLPLVADRTGTAGLALLASGAVSGVEAGVTVGESFDAGRLLRVRESKQAFSPPPRVYLAPLGAFVTREKAQEIFSHRNAKSRLGCTDSACCAAGVADMLREPREHFVRQRVAEVTRIGQIPRHLRTRQFADDFLARASSLAILAERIDPGLGVVRKRIDDWRIVLDAIADSSIPETHAAAPTGRRVHYLRGA